MSLWRKMALLVFDIRANKRKKAVVFDRLFLLLTISRFTTDRIDIGAIFNLFFSQKVYLYIVGLWVFL